jgi:predicted alpha/beta-fold hydrolase
VWESLATTRRQDRFLHGGAIALNVVIGLIATPLWLLGQKLTAPLQRLLRRIDSEPPRLPVPERSEGAMAELMAELEAIPHQLGPKPGAAVRMALADLSSFVLSQQREAANIGYAYPRQFSDHVFEGADGEHIAASVAVHDQPRPGLIVVHGLFSSRRFDYVRRIAVAAYYEWGFNVAAIDLRSFGLTNHTSQAPTTTGWKEGEDVIACARYLKSLGSTTVGAIGISLGGSSVLGACHPDGAAEALDGGILAISPPADPRAIAERLSKRVPPSHPAYLINRGNWALLTSRIREARWEGIDDFLDPLEKVSAPYYEVSPDELWHRSAAVNHIADATVPVLVLHPADDWLIPVSHARDLAAAAAGNDLVRVWELPAGGHGGLEAIDPGWTRAVMRGFCEHWAGYADQPSPAVAKLKG